MAMALVASAKVPTVKLNNGIEMPVMLWGSGPPPFSPLPDPPSPRAPSSLRPVRPALAVVPTWLAAIGPSTPLPPRAPFVVQVPVEPPPPITERCLTRCSRYVDDTVLSGFAGGSTQENATSTRPAVALALTTGFPGIDCANHCECSTHVEPDHDLGSSTGRPAPAVGTGSPRRQSPLNYCGERCLCTEPRHHRTAGAGQSPRKEYAPSW